MVGVWWQALGIDDKNADAWILLGIEGGGTVGSKLYTAQECHEKVLLSAVSPLSSHSSSPAPSPLPLPLSLSRLTHITYVNLKPPTSPLLTLP